MQCSSYIDHGMFLDTINYEKLIQTQANTISSNGVKVVNSRCSKYLKKDYKRPKLKILGK